MDLEKASEELLALVASANTSNAVLAAILDEHEHCFKCEDVCEICEYIEDELFESLLAEFASNPSLSAALQSRVLDLAYEWQGRQYAVLFTFASNSNVSDEIKKATLDLTLITFSSEAADDLPAYLQSFRSNSRYTPDEIRAFIKEANETFELPKGWDK